MAPLGDFTDIMITERRLEAEGVVSLRFTRVDGEPLPPWEPGAHVELRLPSGQIRQYSLCGEGTGDYRIAVLDQPGGRGGSREVHQQGQVGSVWAVRGPRNQFGLVEASDYLLVAGGIGITPILAMVNHLDEGGRSWRLAYGGRTRSSMAFLADLEHRDEVDVLPQDEHGLLDLETLLKSAGDGTAVYCCGPAPMITAIRDLGATHLPEGASLHTERFTPSGSDSDPTPVAASTSCGLLVKLQRSNREVRVAEGQSILDAVRTVVDVPSSCEEGFCGTCETRVLDGTPDHRDDFLTDDERDAGDTMMLCVSRAETPELTLDL